MLPIRRNMALRRLLPRLGIWTTAALWAMFAPADESNWGEGWPVFRGDAWASGVARDALPSDRLDLLWTFSAHAAASRPRQPSTPERCTRPTPTAISMRLIWTAAKDVGQWPPTQSSPPRPPCVMTGFMSAITTAVSTAWTASLEKSFGDSRPTCRFTPARIFVKTASCSAPGTRFSTV